MVTLPLYHTQSCQHLSILQSVRLCTSIRGTLRTTFNKIGKHFHNQEDFQICPSEHRKIFRDFLQNQGEFAALRTSHQVLILLNFRVNCIVLTNLWFAIIHSLSCILTLMMYRYTNATLWQHWNQCIEKKKCKKFSILKVHGNFSLVLCEENLNLYWNFAKGSTAKCTTGITVGALG